MRLSPTVWSPDEAALTDGSSQTVASTRQAAQAFAGKEAFGKFTDATGVAVGLQAYVGRLPGVRFAIGLINAGLIGV